MMHALSHIIAAGICFTAFTYNATDAQIANIVQYIQAFQFFTIRAPLIVAYIILRYVPIAKECKMTYNCAYRDLYVQCKSQRPPILYSQIIRYIPEISLLWTVNIIGALLLIAPKYLYTILWFATSQYISVTCSIQQYACTGTCTEIAELFLWFATIWISLGVYSKWWIAIMAIYGVSMIVNGVNTHEQRSRRMVSMIKAGIDRDAPLIRFLRDMSAVLIAGVVFEFAVWIIYGVNTLLIPMLIAKQLQASSLERFWRLI